MVPATTRLTIDLDADFADRLRAPDGAPDATITVDWDATAGRLGFRATRRHERNLDVRGVAIHLDPAPTGIEALDTPTARRLVYDTDLEAQSGRTITLTFASFSNGEWRTPDQAAAHRSLAKTWRASRTRVSTPEALVGPAVERAADDLLALRAWELEPSTDGSAWVPNAGVPSFTGFFGRDALTAGWQAAMLGVEPLRGALAIAAETQADRTDPWTEAQPGRMVHEMRRGPFSMSGFCRIAPTSAPTTGSMFLLGLSEAWHWSGDARSWSRTGRGARERSSGRSATAIRTATGSSNTSAVVQGLKNQGWKDSDEAIRYPDGRIVPNPIATVEEQAFHYLALQRMAEVLVALDEPLERRSSRRAAALRDAWHQAYWMDDEGFYALALDPDKRQVRTIGLNVGSRARDAGSCRRTLRARSPIG